MQAASILAVAVLLAGCAAEPPAAEIPSAEPIAEAPTWQHFEATYQVSQSEVQTPAGSTGFGGGNCLMLDEEAIINGTATVTWDADPTSPEMELVLSGPDDLVFRTGDGEIVLEFDGFRVGQRQATGSPLAWQVSEGAPAGLANGLQGTLVIVLDYLLENPDDEFSPDDNWGCSIGH